MSLDGQDTSVRSSTRVVCVKRTLVYGVATFSSLLKMIGLFCKRALQNRRYSVAANTRVYSRTCVYQFPCWSIFVCTTCYIIIHVYTTIHVYIVIHICINTRHSFSSLPLSSSVRDFVFFVCVSIAIESYMSYQFLYTNIFVCTNCYIIKHVYTTIHVYIVIHVCISTRHSFSCLSTVVFSS